MKKKLILFSKDTFLKERIRCGKYWKTSVYTVLEQNKSL